MYGLSVRRVWRIAMTDWDNFNKEASIKKRTDRIYDYLRDKYTKEKDDYHLHLLSRQRIENKVRSGASHIDGISIQSGNRAFIDHYDYSYQLDWEQDNWNK